MGRGTDLPERTTHCRNRSASKNPAGSGHQLLALCPAHGGNGAVFTLGKRLPDGPLRRNGAAGREHPWAPAHFLPGDPLCPGDSGGGGWGDSVSHPGWPTIFRSDPLAAGGRKDHIPPGFDPPAEHPGHPNRRGGSAAGAGSPEEGGKYAGFGAMYRCALRLPQGSGHGAAAPGDESPDHGGGRAVGRIGAGNRKGNRRGRGAAIGNGPCPG